MCVTLTRTSRDEIYQRSMIYDVRRVTMIVCACASRVIGTNDESQSARMMLVRSDDRRLHVACDL